MKRVAFFTTSRADFGGFISIIKEIEKTDGISYILFAGGTHLSPEFGETKNEILARDIKVSDEFDFILNTDSPYNLSLSLGTCQIEVARIFKNWEFDFVCVLGDRFELLPVISCAMLFKKPIIHLHGGEITEGAIDNQVRWMITKAAHLHFPTCPEYAENIKKLGEEDWRIKIVGINTLNEETRKQLLKKKDIFKMLGLDVKKDTVILTFHPESVKILPSLDKRIRNIFDALEPYRFQLVITSPNYEAGREVIIDEIKKRVDTNKNYKFYKSLGITNYYSLANCSRFVIGNSSSGINEIPFFRIPTVNIGPRQDGRIRHESIIDTDYSVDNIRKAIDLALSVKFTGSIKKMKFKFAGDESAKIFVNTIKNLKVDNKLIIKTSPK